MPVCTRKSPDPFSGQQFAHCAVSHENQAGAALLRRKAATFASFSHTIFSKINHSVGGFATYVRRDAPAWSFENRRTTDLFPLPVPDLGSANGNAAPRSARQRCRWSARRVEDIWVDLSTRWLNFEAGGRQVNTHLSQSGAPHEKCNRAAASAVAHIRRGVRSMCRAAAGLPLGELGLGRGKIKDSWQSLDELSVYADQLAAEPGRQYRTPTVLGIEVEGKVSVAEEVDVDRVALPSKGAVLDVADLLTGSGLRRAYEDPDSIRLADTAQKPFTGRSCDRLPSAQRAAFARQLDKAGMLHVIGEDTGTAGGVFAVRKKWNADRGVWVQRLVLDRRARNATEELVGSDVMRESMPHGTVWCDVLLDPGEELVLWATDLPSFYYACKVSAARAKSNQFTKLSSLRGLEDLDAVKEYRERVVLGEPGDPARGALCLNTMAMGDINATGFAQAAHRALLRRADALPVEITYRSITPTEPVFGGVMIDDFVIAAKVPINSMRSSSHVPSARDANRRFENARNVYASVGVPDVAEKRRECVADAVVWGCEVRGREGRAGSPLAKRGGLAALSIAIASGGVATGALLSTVLGLWIDVLLYRRPALALLDALLQFVRGREDDRRPRVLPGPVVTELWGLAAVAPLLDTNLRAPVAASVRACDASLEGGGVCEAPLPESVSRELWRVRLKPGPPPRIGLRGFCFAGELAESLAWRTTSARTWRVRESRGINLCEGRARRQMLRTEAANAQQHGTRRLYLYDSTVTAAGAARGRSAAAGLRGEQRRAYPALLAADIQEGVLWCDSERNPADVPSRSGGKQAPLPVPSPARAWVSAFLQGDDGALHSRIQDLENLSQQQSDPLLDEVPDYAAGDCWQVKRSNARIANAHERARSTAELCKNDQRSRVRRAHEQAEFGCSTRVPYTPTPNNVFDSTKGYPGEGPQRSRAADGVARSRSAPAAQRPQAIFDELVLGQPATVSRRKRVVSAFDEWLDGTGEPARLVLEADASRFDRVLARYGQVLWDRNSPQSHFSELLNAIRKLHPVVGGRLKGAWDVRTAWQHLEPGDNKSPVPERLARALIAVSIAWDWFEFAALVMLAFDGALRPGDVLNLHRQDLRFADEHGGENNDLFVVLRHAKTAAMKGARWQHVRITGIGIIRFIRTVFGKRSPDVALFSPQGSYSQRAHALSAQFEQVLGYLQVPYGLRGGFVFSGLRAGGITSLFERTHDLALTRWRGRWDNERSMEHYIQELAVSSAFSELSNEVRTRVFRLSDAFPGIVLRVVNERQLGRPGSR